MGRVLGVRKAGSVEYLLMMGFITARQARERERNSKRERERDTVPPY